MTTYLLKMMLCSGFLLLVYFLFLQTEKMYRFNRFYLLFSIIFSFSVPLITIEGQPEIVPFAEPVAFEQKEIVLTVPEQTATGTGSVHEQSDIHPVLAVWGVVASLLLLRFVRNMFILLRKKGDQCLSYQGAKLLLVTENVQPHSFLQRIYVNKDQFLNSGIQKEIIQHELTHTRQLHSLDILFVELVSCLAWFNPFFYGYKTAIQLNHEFLADKAVLLAYPDTLAYQQLLLCKITARSQQALASSFYLFTTKKRFLMMLKTTSPLKRLIKQALLIPLFVVSYFVFSSKLMAQDISDKTTITTPSYPKSKTRDTSRYVLWFGTPSGYTKEGVSEELLKEYERIIDKYKEPDGNLPKEFYELPEAERERLETIFQRMSLEQQSKQMVGFVKPAKPLPKVTPARQQFENFKNPSIYGVWIDDKKVSNKVLDQYQHTDFSQVFISKLYGTAKKGRTYTHQVDLMTNSYYQRYYEKTINNKRSGMVVRRNPVMKPVE